MIEPSESEVQILQWKITEDQLINLAEINACRFYLALLTASMGLQLRYGYNRTVFFKTYNDETYGSWCMSHASWGTQQIKARNHTAILDLCHLN